MKPLGSHNGVVEPLLPLAATQQPSAPVWADRLKKQPALLTKPNFHREKSLNELHLRIHTVWQLFVHWETTESNNLAREQKTEPAYTSLVKVISTYQALSTLQRSSLLHCGSF